MHWTLLTMIGLCALCLLGNVARFLLVGGVRLSGAFVCGAWIVQQSYWLATGGDSVALFLVCDAAIVWALFRSGWSFTDLVIGMLLPVTWVCWNVGSAQTWWLNWAVVALQMVLGLPWPAPQRINHSISHGRLRVAI
jgi:hypothetical protein